MLHVKTIEGQLEAKGLKVGLVAGRFNDFIVDKLIGGAVDYLTRHGMDRESITLVKAPGAFELPIVAKKMAESKKYDGIVVLGAVIRGATPHFDFVSNECAKGIAQASLESGVPMGFGVLTCDTLEQAIERAGSKAGNKGVEAASALLETIRVLEQL
ncbi:6,7-dimethyl-8-ribityllumazine synthase [Salidesulfovibrio onnuriiensis]|uniref:6,7-dimethyl-8-ribityllumazine synthase n=1 Tax=Salidesulfovibrio onnuriiensis TaxID=2583823 RepID=UPI0011C804CF|nr:6,7-dimethyl-8-ribityllumazine synthase [Salidesulfovibrio onnuriiensis]